MKPSYKLAIHELKIKQSTKTKGNKNFFSLCYPTLNPLHLIYRGFNHTCLIAVSI